MPTLLADTSGSYRGVIDDIGRGFESVGVAAVIIGCLYALVRYGAVSPRGDAAYRSLRKGLARAILLGLELFVAGDIIRTVTVDPSFTTAGVLAIIILIRTFLSFTLEVEVEGRWPWQATAPPGRPTDGSAPDVTAGPPTPWR
jgi:uncharacterized membrane protein